MPITILLCSSKKNKVNCSLDQSHYIFQKSGVQMPHKEATRQSNLGFRVAGLSKPPKQPNPSFSPPHLNHNTALLFYTNFRTTRIKRTDFWCQLFLFPSCVVRSTPYGKVCMKFGREKIHS